MSYSFISCATLLPLFSVMVIIIHNCCANLTESHAINCSQVDCVKSCPADSWLKSTLINYDEEEESHYHDVDLNYYDYNEYNFKDEVDEKSTQLDESSNDYNLETTYRKRRHIKSEVNTAKCCDHYECICKECNDIPQCPVGEVAVLVQEGHNIPGNCCSIYECQKRYNCTELIPNEQVYWRTKCIECRCIGKMEFCKNYCPEKEFLQNCYSDYWRKPIINGGHWNEGPCMSCTCKQGEKKCVTSICPKLQCQEYIRKKNLCCPICKNDQIGQDKDKKHLEMTPFPVSNESDITNFVLTTSNVEPTASPKPSVIDEMSATTNFSFNSAKQEDQVPTSTSSKNWNSVTNPISITYDEQRLMNVTSHNPITLKPPTIGLNNETLWNEIFTTPHSILTNKPTLNKTLSSLNDIIQLSPPIRSTSSPIKASTTNIDLLETTTTESTKSTIPLIEVTNMPIQTNSTVLTVINTTESSISLSTIATSSPPNILYFNKTLIAKETQQHSILLNDFIFVIIIGILALIVLSISLGLAILFIRNRKKMYSCIPNSEASLSQTSTNTVLTL